MMKMKLKSRNFENLQCFSAFSRTSEQISLNSAKIATNFENANNLAFITLRTPKTLTKFAEILRSERCKSMQILWISSRAFQRV